MVGWALWGIAFFFILRVARLDRRLVRFRVPGTPAAAYLGHIGRWRRALYTAEGQPLIGQTRLAFGLFVVFSVLGVIVFERFPLMATR